jgi:hypothetical protein
MSDEETRMAEAGEGGDDAAMIQHTTAGEFFRHFEKAAKINLKRNVSPEKTAIRVVSQEREENESVRAYLDADDRALHETLAKAVDEPEVDEPEAGSKSSTLSMIAACLVSGSWTT